MEFVVLKEGNFDKGFILHAVFIVYLIFAPLGFFAPLSTAHEAMRHAKEKLLVDISKQFNEDFTATHNELKGSANDLKDNIEKIEQLQRLHTLTKEFPVWPFDTGTIRKFAIYVSTPIMTIIASKVFDLIIDLLNKRPPNP